MGDPDLLARLGGASAVTDAVHRWHQLLREDVRIAPALTGCDQARLEDRATLLLKTAFDRAGGLDIGRRTALLAVAHGRLTIDDDVFDRAVGAMLDAFTGVGSDLDAVDELMTYLAGLRAAIVPAWDR